MNNFDITDWVNLSDIPAVSSYKVEELYDSVISFWKSFSGGRYTGIYQASFSKPKDVVHKSIGYIGESGFLPKRLSDLRSSATQGNKVSHHHCGVYLREESIDHRKVFVRCLLTDENNLEKYLQKQHREKFGYEKGFAWQEASGGIRSYRTQIQDKIKRIESVEVCEQLIEALNQQIIKLKE
jgi:hypothetical protein